MRYQIIYIKLEGSAPWPFSTWTDSEEDARRKAEQLRKAGYSVDVWERTETGSRKTDF